MNEVDVQVIRAIIADSISIKKKKQKNNSDQRLKYHNNQYGNG